MTKVIPIGQFKYGKCRTCDNPIDHPGLDHSHCPKCGWVAELEWLTRMPPTSEQEVKPKAKRKRSL